MSPRENTRRTLVFALILTGIVTVAVGIGVGIAVAPAYLAIAVFGLLDLVLAWMFHSGRVGTTPTTAGPTDPAPADPTQDPSYNPYARED